jgi:hypothetical protein
VRITTNSKNHLFLVRYWLIVAVVVGVVVVAVVPVAVYPVRRQSALDR